VIVIIKGKNLQKDLNNLPQVSYNMKKSQPSNKGLESPQKNSSTKESMQKIATHLSIMERTPYEEANSDLMICL